VKEMVTLWIIPIMGYFLTLEIPLKEGIGGERDGDFMDNSYKGLFLYFADTTERGDKG